MSKAMSRFIGAGWALVTAAAALPAMADAPPQPPFPERPFYFTAMFHAVPKSDNQRDSQDFGYGGDFGLGATVHPLIDLELDGEIGRFPRDPPGDDTRWKEYGFSAASLFYYDRKPTFSPFFSIAAGVIHNTRIGMGRDSATDPFGKLGLGFTSRFYGSLLFRFDAAARLIGLDDSLGGRTLAEPVVSVGLVVPFGPERAAAETPPAAEEAPPAACPDADADGVCDDRDRCPGTPQGVRVDAHGCPVDSDGDGVPDYLDKCPNTPRGVQVDANGCPQAQAFERKFEDVNFAFDKSSLTDYAKVSLDKTASDIKGLEKQYPNLRIEVNSYTDAVGTDTYNMALSRRRASSVKDYLVRKGVEESRIATQSLGSASPIATNETGKGRLLNRRVEIRAKSE